MNRSIRIVVWIVGFLATAYIAIAALLWSQQGKLLYPAPRMIGSTTGAFEKVSYPTEDNLIIRAGYRQAAAGQPTLLYFHGNGTDWVSTVMATDRLVPVGYGVLAAEYRGYRGNPGSPSEEGLYRDGRAAVAFLQSEGLDAQQIVIIGNSIGSGVAVEMARDIHPLALILISPFASLSDLVAEKFRWLPTGLLLRDRYENASKLAGIRSDILILHGDADSLIPHDHAKRLAAANPRAQLRIFPGAGHDLAWQDVAEEAVLDFLDEPIHRRKMR